MAVGLTFSLDLLQNETCRWLTLGAVICLSYGSFQNSAQSGGIFMLHRSWRKQEKEFTSGQLLMAVLVNLLLLIVCYLSYQAAYRIETNPNQHLLLYRSN
jgi:hypothetical protein